MDRLSDTNHALETSAEREETLLAKVLSDQPTEESVCPPVH
jgi:hypothetical protein